jgi:hypothetical protein
LLIRFCLGILIMYALFWLIGSPPALLATRLVRCYIFTLLPCPSAQELAVSGFSPDQPHAARCQFPLEAALAIVIATRPRC